jgi:hypothetical protein
VPAGETWRRVLALVAEYGSFAAVARELRFTDPHVQFYGARRISWKNYVKVARLFRAVHEA